MNKPPVIDAVHMLVAHLEPPVSEGYILAYWSSDPHNSRPLFWTERRRKEPQWLYVGGSAHVYSTYAEAAASGDELPWIRNLPPEGKRVVKVRFRAPVEIVEHYPVDVLDALAEV